MGKEYAELMLYFAFVAASGSGEGKYEREPSDRGSKLAVAQAKEVIKKYLHPDWQWGLHYGWCEEGVASNEQEALSLIRHAKIYLPNSTGAIVPYDQIHGTLRFHRIIRFEGIAEDQEDEIISVMKESGHLPYTKEQSRMDRLTNQEKINQMNDNKWRTALKFYSPHI